jgi:hypothetical protein
VAGREYEISLRAKWLSGSPQLNTRLYFNQLPRTTILETPTTSGSPGSVNSVAVANIGPTYDALQHAPAVPTPDQPVTVTLTAADADGIASMTLWYSVAGGAWQTVVMDANDGKTFAAMIPPQASGSVVQFYIKGVDARGAVSQFPATGAASRALYQVADGSGTTGPQHQFRIIMTDADWDAMFEPTNRMTNHRMGATVVFGEQQVYYDAQIRLKGSGFSRGSAASGFNIRFGADQLLFGEHDVIAIDRQGGPWGIGASHRELTLKHIGNAAGNIPMMYDDAIYLVAPDPGFNGTAQLLGARYDDVFLESQFENGGDGTRFKFDLIYYSTLTANGSPEGLKLPPANFPANVFPVLGVDIQNMGDDPNNYRWNHLIRNNRARDDYSQVIAMGKAFQLTGSTVGGALDLATQAVIDVDQWMRLFAFESLVGINDTYNQGLQHNLQFYVRPADNRVVALPWDMDFSFHQPTNMPIYGTGSNLRKIIDIPSNLRLFQGHLYDIINTTYNAQYLTPWVQHIATRSVQNDSTAILNYVSARRSFVLGQLMPQVPFAITTNGGVDFSVASNTVQLSGNGWINVREIRRAGESQPLDVTWTDQDSWRIDLALIEGANSIVLEAYDFQGQLVASDSVTITSSVANPVVSALRITEINYHPADATPEELAAMPGIDSEEFEFLEFTNVGNVPLQLLNVRLDDGIEFTFDETILAAGERGVVVQNSAAFQLRYGTSARILGEFASGRLSNSGERVVLLSAEGETIVDLSYGDRGLWPEAADGLGATLELRSEIVPAGSSPAVQWRSSSRSGGSPGTIGPGAVGIVINEVLTNTSPPYPLRDAIELFNASSASVDLSGWFLSDSGDEPDKFRIPDGTVLGPGAYLVFTEADFNPTPLTPGPRDFALSSSSGDDVWLTQVDATGRIVEFVDEVHFEGAELGIAYGRVPNGTGRLVPLSRVSLGCENGPASVGGVVITELQFAPGAPNAQALALYPTLTPDLLEFIELANDSLAPVDLSQWQLTGGVDWQFPSGALMQPGETLVLVTFNPVDASNQTLTQAFRAQYGLGDQVVLYGPYDGQLHDATDWVNLLRPGTPPVDRPDELPRIPVDSVVYQTMDSWPITAPGTGQSLQRSTPVGYGNVAETWLAATPTPNVASFPLLVAGDLTGDRLVTSDDVDRLWDIVHDTTFASRRADVNNDARVDSVDVRYLVESILQTRMGDANLDGQVDGTDLSSWNNHRFEACGTWQSGDFNGDGATDVADFNIWNANKFQTPVVVHASTGRTPRAAASSDRSASFHPQHVDLAFASMMEQTARRRSLSGMRDRRF